MGSIPTSPIIPLFDMLSLPNKLKKNLMIISESTYLNYIALQESWGHQAF